MTFCKYKFILILLLVAQVCAASDWMISRVNIDNNGEHLQINIQSLKLPDSQYVVRDIKYHCQSFTQFYPVHTCENGRIEFSYEGFYYRYLIDGWFDFNSNQWQIDLSNAKKTLEIHSDSKQSNKLNVSINKMTEAELANAINSFFALDVRSTSVIISAQITIEIGQETRVIGNYELNDFSWESDNGEFVFAETQMQGIINIKNSSQQTEISLLNEINKGEGLFKDVYILFDENPLNILSTFILDKDNEPENIKFKLTSTKDINIEIDILDWYKNNLNISFDILDASRFYQGFLSSYFEIVGINDAEVEGQIKGQIAIENSEIKSINAEIKESYLAIESKKLELNNLNVIIDWQEYGEFKQSSFQWDDLLLAGMPVNKSSLKLASVGQQLKLEENTILPIFDGSLIINKLSLKDLFEPEISIQFDGEVKPISLSLITEKMNWPIMQGSISGKIPGMTKQGHSITFDGLLEMSVFNGQIQVDNLSMERLFGIAPVIAADIKFNNLDLHLLTSTYDFGDITGLIQGYIKDLRITNWKPDRLTAYFESVKTKGIKQTISQRAIDNISSIGGIQGALSRTFLKFFDYFKYKRIGIGCKLRNSICEMKGLNNTNDTYHLIEGKGIPSINIIGFRKYIDWEVFLDRLLNASF